MAVQGGTLFHRLAVVAIITLFSCGLLSAAATTVVVDSLGSDPNPSQGTSANTIDFTVVFGVATTGLTAANLQLVTTGTFSGPFPTLGTLAPGDNITWTVSVTNVTGNGTISLTFTNDSGLSNTVTSPVSSNTAFTVQSTPPSVLSSVPVTPGPTASSSIDFTVTFSEGVSAVATNAGIFAIATASGSVGTPTIGTPQATGNPAVWTVPVTGISGAGTFTLSQTTAGSVVDAAGNALSGTFTSGSICTIDQTAPLVSSIACNGSTTTSASTVGYTVTFSKPVTNVLPGDFSLAETGITGGTISISPVSSSLGSVWTATVSGFTGTGTLGLNLTTLSGIADSLGNVLASSGADTGALFTITSPVSVSSIVSATGATVTNDTTVTFTVTFSGAVSGVTAANFAALVATGTFGTFTIAIPAATGGSPATVWTVAVSTISGTGTFRLGLVSTTGIMDGVGNPIAGTFTSGGTCSIDQTNPLVSSMTVSTTNPTNSTSAVFTVNFSRAVTSVTTADFTPIASGLTGASIASVSGSGSTYTVTVSGYSGAGTLGLGLTGAATSDIQDQYGNFLISPFPASQVYTLDLTAPLVSSIACSGSTTTSVTTVAFAVTFSTPVTNVLPGDFTLAETGITGGVISISPVASSVGSVWTATVSGFTGTGTLGLNLTTLSGITDSLGNVLASSGADTGAHFTITSAVSVSSITPSTGGSTTDDTSVTFTVTFSGAVSGVTTANFAALVAIGTFGTFTVGTPVPTGGSPATVWTVAVSTISGTGTFRLGLVSIAGIADTVGSGNPIAATYITGTTCAIDQTNPQVSSLTVTTTNPINSTSAVFTVNFSRPVSGVLAQDFTPVVTSLGGTAAVGAVAAVGGAPPRSSWTVTVSGYTGKGTLGLGLSAHAATDIIDQYGNQLTGTYPTSPLYTLNLTAPTVSSIVLTSATPTRANAISYTVTFSEPVSSVGTVVFTATTLSGSFTGVTIGTPVGTAPTATWTVPVTGITGSGTLRLDQVAAGSVVDGSSNALIGTFASGSTCVIDQTLPVVISSIPVVAGPTSASTAVFTVVFSTAVQGVTAANFSMSVASGSFGTFTIGTPTSSGSPNTTWSVPVSGISGTGTVVLNQSASNVGVTDVLGNALSGTYTSGSPETINQAQPFVVSSTPSIVGPSNTTTVNVAVVFSKAVTGVAASDFSPTVVSGAFGPITIGTPTTTNNITWTVPVSGIAGTGTMRIDLSAIGSIIDSLSNHLVGTYTSGTATVIDQTLPVVLSSVPATLTTVAATSMNFTVTFSKAVNGVNAGDFTATVVSGAFSSLSIGTPTASSPPSTTWTVPVTGISGTGTFRVDQTHVTAIADALGNPLSGTFTLGQVCQINQTAPQVASITFNGTSPTNATSITWNVVFTSPVSGVASTNFALATTGSIFGAIIGTPTPAGALPNAQWTIAVSGISGSGTVGLNQTTDTGIVDTTGNTLLGTTTGPVVTVDSVQPTVSAITLTGPSLTNASAVTFNITFSEPVNGVTLGDFTLATTGSFLAMTPVAPNGGTLPSATWTLSVTGISGNGTLGLNQTSGAGITDSLGNSLAGVFVGPMYAIDNTSPAVTSFTIAGSASALTLVNQATFLITFSAPVTNVLSGDFTVVAQDQLSGGTIGSPVPINGIANFSQNWSITVQGFTGSGHLRLDLASAAADPSTGIVDQFSNVVVLPTDSPTLQTVRTYGIDNGPVLVTNSPISITAGATVVLQGTTAPSNLIADDFALSSPTQVLYQITAPFSQGKLIAVATGQTVSSFTQDDLNQGRLSYINFGGLGNASDTMVFSLSAQETPTAILAPGVFTFTIAVSRTLPELLLNSSTPPTFLDQTLAPVALFNALTVLNPDGVVVPGTSGAEHYLVLAGSTSAQVVVSSVAATPTTLQQVIPGTISGDGQDALIITPDGSNITLGSSQSILFAGTQIATYSGGAAGSNLVINFPSTNVTEDMASELMQCIQFENLSRNPSAALRQISALTTVTFLNVPGSSATVASLPLAPWTLQVQRFNYPPTVPTPATLLTLPSVPTPGTVGATDPDSVVTYTLSGLPTKGTVIIAADGTFIYTAQPGQFGTDTFTITIDDHLGFPDNNEVVQAYSVLISAPSAAVPTITSAAPMVIATGETFAYTPEVTAAHSGLQFTLIDLSSTHVLASASTLSFNQSDGTISWLSVPVPTGGYYVFGILVTDAAGNTAGFQRIVVKVLAAGASG